MLKVSVIILNYNSANFLGRCLKSVLNSDYSNFEVVFVDNDSTDDSVGLVKDLFGRDSRLKIIVTSENLGFAEGNNIGIKYATGEYIVFLNADTEVECRWLKELIHVMDKDLRIGAAQSKLLLMYDERRFDSAGHFLDYCGIESVESASVQGQADTGQFNQLREIFYARGAAMITRRKVLDEVGPFDPAYFTDHEEIDLCWRIRLGGYKIVYVPKSVVYHACGGASSQARKNKPAWITFHLRKNHIASLIKNYELLNLVKYLPIYLIYLALHGGYKIIKGDIRMLTAYCKAVFWNLTNFRYIYSERKRVQSIIRKVPDKYIMKYMAKPVIPLHFLNNRSILIQGDCGS